MPNDIQYYFINFIAIAHMHRAHIPILRVNHFITNFDCFPFLSLTLLWILVLLFDLLTFSITYVCPLARTSYSPYICAG